MKGRVPKKELGNILVQAKCAAKNIRAQRERLLQFQLQPNQPVGSEAPAQLSTDDDVATGLFLVYFQGLEAGARYLTTCVATAAQNGELPSLPLDFGVIPDEKLFDRLLALRLPRRPVTQAQAIARLEAALYAVKLTQEYCLKRCLQHLAYPPCCAATDDDSESSVDGLSLPDTTDESQDDGEIGLPEPVAAAADDLAKIAIPAPDATATDTQDSSEIGPSDPVTAASERLAKIKLSDTVAAATEDLAKIGLSASDAAATDEPSQDDIKTGLSAPAIGETPQAATIDMDQARTYLNHACTLADLAVKHVDLAVTAISSCLDPEQVASISAFADSVAYTK